MNKKQENKALIKKTIILAIFLIYQELFLMHLFTNGLLSHYGYSINNIASIGQLLIMAVLFLIITMCFLIMLNGYYLEKKYARKFTILYLLWVSVFPLWAIIVSSNQALNAIVLLANISIIVYLVAIPLKQEYIKTSDQILIRTKQKFRDIVVNINQHITHKHN